MSEPLYRTEPYRQEATVRVTAVTEEGGIVTDGSIFYPTGGGQPGDSGRLVWPGGELVVATALKGPAGSVVLVPGQPRALPAVGTHVMQILDWDRRLRHMRMHTALHLLSVVIALPVTGGAISAAKGRLDFAMPEPLSDKGALEAELNALIARDLPVIEDWITDAELAANPGLVKTMSVKPPTGSGRVRLIRIGQGDAQVDLQPCGGTHVARTGEIGPMRIGKIENKGRQNRRVNILFAEAG